MKIVIDVAKTKGKIRRECLHCKKEFYVYPSQAKRGGRFCSTSCTTTYRNLTDNPAKRLEVRRKISDNHADVSGKNNPMYGRKPPSYIDGRSYFSSYYRMVALKDRPPICEKCGIEVNRYRLHVHHIDRNRENNVPENLMILCAKCHFDEHKESHLSRPRDRFGRFTKEEKSKCVL